MEMVVMNVGGMKVWGIKMVAINVGGVKVWMIEMGGKKVAQMSHHGACV